MKEYVVESLEGMSPNMIRLFLAFCDVWKIPVSRPTHDFYLDLTKLNDSQIEQVEYFVLHFLKGRICKTMEIED